MRGRVAFGVVPLVVGVLGSPVLLACRPAPAPGELIGTYSVQGTLTDNACGAGFDPVPSFSFTAELRRETASATWRMNDGPRVAGSIRSDGEVLFRVTSVVEGWPANPATGTAGCRYVQTETIAGRVSLVAQDAGDAAAGDAAADAGADAGASRGRLTLRNDVDIAASPGSDCSAAVGVGPGQFAMLPCRATFLLEGTPQ